MLCIASEQCFPGPVISQDLHPGLPCDTDLEFLEALSPCYSLGTWGQRGGDIPSQRVYIIIIVVGVITKHALVQCLLGSRRWERSIWFVTSFNSLEPWRSCYIVLPIWQTRQLRFREV